MEIEERVKRLERVIKIYSKALDQGRKRMNLLENRLEKLDGIKQLRPLMYVERENGG